MPHNVKVKKVKKVKADIALNDTPSHSYGTSLATHTVLPATWRKWTRPA